MLPVFELHVRLDNFGIKKLREVIEILHGKLSPGMPVIVQVVVQRRNGQTERLEPLGTSGDAAVGVGKGFEVYAAGKCVGRQLLDPTVEFGA